MSTALTRLLLKQAAVLPLITLLIPMVWGFFVPGYSSMAQQQSELQLLQHPIALAMRILPVITGLSVLGFAAALLLLRPRMVFTALSAAVLAASMVANGLFVAGDPRHGLYGLTLFCVLVPACFAAELPREGARPRAVSPSLATASAILGYLWLMSSGLHPQDFRGLSQRLALILIFGWYAYASAVLLCHRGRHAAPEPATR